MGIGSGEWRMWNHRQYSWQSIFMAVMNDTEHAQSAGNVQTRDIVDIMGHVLTHVTYNYSGQYLFQGVCTDPCDIVDTVFEPCCFKGACTDPCDIVDAVY